jgi:serine/threonine protein kinase
MVFALKQIKKDTVAKNKMGEQLLMEIKMQFHFSQRNVLKLYGVFSDQEFIYLVL